MTQQQKDDLTKWLEERFPILSKNDVYLITMHVEHYFLPLANRPDYNDENPDQVKQSLEEI